MRPILGSVLTGAALAVLANVVLFASLLAPSDAHGPLLMVAGALIVATLATALVGALARRTPHSPAHPSTTPVPEALLGRGRVGIPSRSA